MRSDALLYVIYSGILAGVSAGIASNSVLVGVLVGVSVLCGIRALYILLK